MYFLHGNASTIPMLVLLLLLNEYVSIDRLPRLNRLFLLPHHRVHPIYRCPLDSLQILLQQQQFHPEFPARIIAVVQFFKLLLRCVSHFLYAILLRVSVVIDCHTLFLFNLYVYFTCTGPITCRRL